MVVLGSLMVVLGICVLSGSNGEMLLLKSRITDQLKNCCIHLCESRILDNDFRFSHVVKAVSYSFSIVSSFHLQLEVMEVCEILFRNPAKPHTLSFTSFGLQFDVSKQMVSFCLSQILWINNLSKAHCLRALVCDVFRWPLISRGAHRVV